MYTCIEVQLVLCYLKGKKFNVRTHILITHTSFLSGFSDSLLQTENITVRGNWHSKFPFGMLVCVCMIICHVSVWRPQNDCWEAVYTVYTVDGSIVYIHPTVIPYLVSADHFIAILNKLKVFGCSIAENQHLQRPFLVTINAFNSSIMFEFRFIWWCNESCFMQNHFFFAPCKFWCMPLNWSYLQITGSKMDGDAVSGHLSPVLCQDDGAGLCCLNGSHLPLE